MTCRLEGSGLSRKTPEELSPLPDTLKSLRNTRMMHATRSRCRPGLHGNDEIPVPYPFGPGKAPAPATARTPARPGKTHLRSPETGDDYGPSPRSQDRNRRTAQCPDVRKRTSHPAGAGVPALVHPGGKKGCRHLCNLPHRPVSRGPPRTRNLPAHQ